MGDDKTKIYCAFEHYFRRDEIGANIEDAFSSILKNFNNYLDERATNTRASTTIFVDFSIVVFAC